jgi:hypothetical protein
VEGLTNEVGASVRTETVMGGRRDRRNNGVLKGGIGRTRMEGKC